ncbi:hypothetical protein F2P56_008410 [Juglans regia]|uniref:Avr9/Cf-9 rapidly elicited protein 137 n=2 Tax=Juglans regia TaxID=51240 RepID=A0A833XM37_JUGRE|nr:uncharacterized protein LOC109017147 [Juglans regia]KAF5471632.1 hypothetical protein F2P56_008410 [Juglans regia]
MVVATMAWLSGASKKIHPDRHLPLFSHHDKSPPATLGILAFETAKTMSRLISLYRSLTDDEISKLKKETMKSKGIAFLNSIDEGFLLNLACAERLEDLNQVAITVSRLGHKCSDFGLSRFDLAYNDLKLGVIDMGKLGFRSSNIQKIIRKMEKRISATANLYAALESLAEMEASERKVQRWKDTGLGPKQKTNLDYLNQKIAFHKKQVQQYKETSLWSQSFDRSVGLMARIVFIIYARICTVFGPYNPCLPSVLKNFSRPTLTRERQPFWNVHFNLKDEEIYGNYCLIERREKNEKLTSKSGPIPNKSKMGMVRFLSNEMMNPFFLDDPGCTGNTNCGAMRKINRVFGLAPPSTVGGSGISVRYANVILYAERCLYTPETIGEDGREELYNMLPANLKSTVRGKLKRHWLKKEEESDGFDGYSLAEGWREALEEILGWLAPLAHDTVRWQAQRNLEKRINFDPEPTVLLLQTLHYADLEKTEATIVDVLVGLSCIYMYENRW